jgi:hypothetical protein
MTDRQLVAGETYFLLLYDGDEPPIPVIQTLVFNKRTRTDAGEDILLFRYVPPDDSEDRPWFLPISEVDRVLTLDELAKALEHASKVGPFRP